MKNNIELKVEEIKESILYKVSIDTSNIVRGGLYNGEFGSLLFLIYYSKYRNDSTIEINIHQYAQRILENMNEYVGNHTFCSGYIQEFYICLNF